VSRSARSARTGVIAAGAAAGALFLAACAPTTTNLEYAPSDGARVEISDELLGHNLLVVSEGDGAQGAVVGALSNRSGEDVTFVLEAEGAFPVDVPVAAGQTVYLGTDDGFEALLDTVSVAPGGDLESSLTAGDTTEEFFLPVLDGTLPEYADYLP
jgi:hypothetical protein